MLTSRVRSTFPKAHVPRNASAKKNASCLPCAPRGGLDLTALKEDTRDAEAVLEECAHHGLSQKENDRWRLTPQGFLVSNAVIVRVLEALSL